MDLLSRPDGADNCTVCRFGDACAKFNPNVSNLLARRSHLPWLMRRPSLELDERTRSLQPRERLEYPPRVSRAGLLRRDAPALGPASAPGRARIAGSRGSTPS